VFKKSWKCFSWDYKPFLNSSFVDLKYSPNIALEAYVIKAAGFTGMTCTVFQKVAASDRTGLSDYGRRDPDGNLDKQLSFKCNVSSTFSSLALKVGYGL
jgi:G protein-coupled receptor 125